MSSVYHTEPPTAGKVLLHTSGGDIDIELWPKEAPLACRNFIQLCLEGYYENTPIHRVIKEFMLQMGDPTGTGTGGESIWGRPFKDEIHGRIKFNHRGQVAMANENKPNTNQSQFFITLGACDWIDRKHTIFGKVTGNTIFNVMRMGDVEVDDNDRPAEELLIVSTEVLWNPFEDIVPRNIVRAAPTSSGKQAAGGEPDKKKARKAVKDKKLLSFGDDEDDNGDNDDEDEGRVPMKKITSSHDAKDRSGKLSAQVASELASIDPREADADAEYTHRNGSERGDGSSSSVLKGAQRGGTKSADDFEGNMMKRMLERRRAFGQNAEKVTRDEENGHSNGDIDSEDDDMTSMHMNARDSMKAAEVARKADEFKRLRGELLRSKRAIKVLSGADAEQHRQETAYRELNNPLEQRRQKFLKRKKDFGDRQDDTLSRLSAFTSSLRATKKTDKPGEEGGGSVRKGLVERVQADTGAARWGEEAVKKGEETSIGNLPETYSGQVLEKGYDDAGDDDGDDDGAAWYAGKLKFKKHIDDQYRMGGDGRRMDDYEVIDSRDLRRGSERDRDRR